MNNSITNKNNKSYYYNNILNEIKNQQPMLTDCTNNNNTFQECIRRLCYQCITKLPKNTINVNNKFEAPIVNNTLNISDPLWSYC